MIIDSYSHCGISKFLPVEDVLATMKEAGVDRTVLCQHLGEYDNRYLAGAVAANNDRFAGVCMVDPEQHNAADQLRDWLATGSFRGLRVLAEWLPRHSSLMQAAIDMGLNLVVYAPEGMATEMPHIQALAQSRPEAKIIITHLGNPKVENGRLTSGTELLNLASSPAVYVQLSGQSMFCEYPYKPLNSLVSATIQRFGPDRLMWGSNFPVCGDRHAYQRDLHQVRSGAWGLAPGDVERVIGRNAQRLWFD